MKVVMAEPGQYARAAEIGDGLESLQKAVGGLIDCAYPWREKVCIVCNDEGLINGMPMNRAVERYGALAGPFFICGISGENFCSLTDAQVQKYRKMFLRPQIFLHTERGAGYLEYDNVTLPGAPKAAPGSVTLSYSRDPARRRRLLTSLKNETVCRSFAAAFCPVRRCRSLSVTESARMFRWKYGSREKGRKRSPAV